MWTLALLVAVSSVWESWPSLIQETLTSLQSLSRWRGFRGSVKFLVHAIVTHRCSWNTQLLQEYYLTVPPCPTGRLTSRTGVTTNFAPVHGSAWQVGDT